MSTDNVTLFPGAGGQKQHPIPNDTLVDMLRDLLHRAETGELQTFVGTGFTADGLRLTMWGPPHEDVFRMMGAITWMQHEYLFRCVEDGASLE